MSAECDDWNEQSSGGERERGPTSSNERERVRWTGGMGNWRRGKNKSNTKIIATV